jgi:hypothetical protein
MKIILPLFIFLMTALSTDLIGQKNNKFISQSSDTLYAAGKVIIYFMPTEKEYNEQYKRDGDSSGINEVLSDFKYYSKIVSDSLLNSFSEIKAIITSKSIISVEQFDSHRLYFNRRENIKHIVGAILSDGRHNPQYLFGVLSDVDYWNVINEYFKKNGH